MRTLPSGARPGHFVDEYVAAMSERFSACGHSTPNALRSKPTSSVSKPSETVAEDECGIPESAACASGATSRDELLGGPAFRRDDDRVAVDARGHRRA